MTIHPSAVCSTRRPPEANHDRGAKCAYEKLSAPGTGVFAVTSGESAPLTATGEEPLQFGRLRGGIIWKLTVLRSRSLATGK